MTAPVRREIPHGSHSRYMAPYRCRCDLCREAHRLAAWKARGSTIRRIRKVTA